MCQFYSCFKLKRTSPTTLTSPYFKIKQRKRWRFEESLDQNKLSLQRLMIIWNVIADFESTQVIKARTHCGFWSRENNRTIGISKTKQGPRKSRTNIKIFSTLYCFEKGRRPIVAVMKKCNDIFWEQANFHCKNH